MCGIIGYSGFKDSSANPMVLKFLILYNEIRGQDAMGFYSKESGIIKKEGKPRDLLGKEEFKIPTTNQFIGHVRAASSGGNGDDKAHPFQQGNIVLAMNGTISNHWTLCGEYGIDTKPLWVDSDYLCAMLNKTQNKEPLTKIDGGCACVYIDTKTDVMYVYRNVERTLYKGYLEEGMYISSTKESLESVNCTKIEEFKQDRLYEIVNGSIVKTYNVKRYVKPVTTSVTNYNNITSYYDSYSHRSYKKVELNFMGKASLVGQWLQPTRSFINAAGASYDQDKRYLVIKDDGYVAPMQITVFNPILGRGTICQMINFSDRIPVLEKDDYVFAIQDITLQSGKHFCKQGHMLVIEGIESKNGVYKIHVRVADGDATCYFDKDCFRYIRAITNEERDEWWTEYSSESVKEYLKENIKPVIQLPEAPVKLTHVQEFAKLLDDKKLDSYDDLVDTIIDNMNEQITDLESFGVDSYTEQIIDKMKVIMKYFRACDEAYLELYGREEKVAYGG